MTDDTIARVDAAAHYARVTTALTLAATGALAVDGVDGLAEALEEVGIRPPCRLIDEQRAAYPHLYRVAEDTDPNTDLDVANRLAYSALRLYAETLLDLAAAIDTLETDPATGVDTYGDTDGLTVPIAYHAETLLEDYRDRLDHTIGESYRATVDAGG